MQGRKMIAACQELKSKEWETFIFGCEELIVWMTTQQRMLVESGQNMARKDMEELIQSQVRIFAYSSVLIESHCSRPPTLT